MWYDIIVFVYIYINIWQQSDGFQDLSRLNAPALCRGFFYCLKSYALYGSVIGPGMEVYMKNLFLKVKEMDNFPLEDAEKKDKLLHEQFDRIVFHAERMEDISDIPDETLLYFLSNIDTYIGGETPLQEKRNEIVENFFEMPNLGLRVL